MRLEYYPRVNPLHYSIRTELPGEPVSFYVVPTVPYREGTNKWRSELPPQAPEIVTSTEDSQRYFQATVQEWREHEGMLFADLNATVQLHGEIPEDILERIQVGRRKSYQLGAAFLFFDQGLVIPEDLRKFIRSVGKVKDFTGEKCYKHAKKSSKIARSGIIDEYIAGFQPAAPEAFHQKKFELLSGAREKLAIGFMDAETHHEVVRKPIRHFANVLKNARYVNKSPGIHAAMEYMIHVNNIIGSFQGRLGDERVAGYIDEEETMVYYSDELQEDIVQFLDWLMR